MNRPILSAVLSAFLSLGGDFAVSAEPDAEGIAFFEKKIRPVLVEHCHQCHSAESKPLQGGLRVDHRDGMRTGGESGPAIVPGKPDESMLIAALKYDGLQMPPKGKLPAHVVADFVRWIEMGAPDPRTTSGSAARAAIDYAQAAQFWAFQRPVAPPVPQVNETAWPKSDLDRFVLSKLEAAGLAPNPPADRRTLIRRASFDLIGLPPTPQEVESFVNDPVPDAFEKVVDRLLDSPHYGERWGRRWLDVARYAEDQAHTFKARNYPQGYRYRDWVVKALNDDMPYDRFLRLQIAADLIAPDQPEHLPALGLFALGPVYYQDNGEQAKALADEHDDRLDTLARGVWGLTLACARCHDHKFDPLSMQDYYGLAGVFASSDYQERPIVPREVLDRKAAAVAATEEQQLKINRLLAAEARALRPSLVNDLSKHVVAGWVARNRLKANPKDKTIVPAVAKQQQVSEFLLQRWVEALDPTRQGPAEARLWLKPYFDLVASHDEKKDLSKDEAALAAIRSVGDDIQALAVAKVASRERLFARFGENVAFVAPEDRASVPAGVIPLGNLFDDAAGVTLADAVASDRFRAVATDKSLGVDRVAQGWGKETDIAPGIRFDFDKLGSDGQKHGAVTNDAWDATGALRTKGQAFPSTAPRAEQGIGMHANALVTFDLKEIRLAGLIPSDTKLVFRVDRAGLNDDVFGSSTPSVHVAVIVSRPHQKTDVYDAILGLWVNGNPMTVQENDRVYYPGGEVPRPLRADGTFASFTIPLPPEARYLTLVATGAGTPDGNSINSDHAVFSGARLERDPLPASEGVAASPGAGEAAPADAGPPSEVDRLDALFLSALLYDQGLLALPPAEAEPRLAGPAKEQLSALRKEHDARKQAADAIAVPMAHALAEGKAKDHPLYLLGNPAKAADPVPRSIPAIFTGGDRKPFDPAGSGRRALAEAIASPENPLTHRVIVNRVWAGHFGFGLVRTPSNFGELGERPTHSELLDWLAAGAASNGRTSATSGQTGLKTHQSSRSSPDPRPPAPDLSLKRLHRDILLSATYQQSSAFDPKKAAIDPENRLLWRMNRQRLEVEPWRDAMLAVSGELDRTVGGPSIDLMKSDNRRRTLYAFVSRHQLNELLRLFDFPDPNITSDRRTVTTVPLQQLFVLNSGFMADRARALAKRLETDSRVGDADDAARVVRAFELVYSRPPRKDELDAALAFVAAPAAMEDQLTPWEQLALALLGSNEFAFVD